MNDRVCVSYRAAEARPPLVPQGRATCFVRCLILTFGVGFVATTHTQSLVRADVVVGGSMRQNLDSAVFRDPSIADEALWAFFGAPLTPAQPLLVFGAHFAPAATAGKSITQFRPLPVDGSLVPISAPGPALPRPNYRDDSSAIEASITAYGSTSDLHFGVNGTVVPSGLPGRAEQSSTFSFDPNDPLATTAGAVGLDGATAFWYANTAAIDTGSVWMVYGDLSLFYNPARATGSNSGWVLENHLLYTDTAYDIRNFAMSNVVAATSSTPGSVTITGDLHIGPGFAGFGLDEGVRVGSFTLDAITAVPEPSTLMLGCMAGAALVAAMLRRTLS